MQKGFASFGEKFGESTYLLWFGAAIRMKYRLSTAKQTVGSIGATYQPSHWVCKPAYLVPVLSQDKLGGLQQEGHPM